MTLSDDFIHRDRLSKAKTFPAGDFNRAEAGQKCSRWGCDKPAVSSRMVGGKKLGACSMHKKEMVEKAKKKRDKINSNGLHYCPTCGQQSLIPGSITGGAPSPNGTPGASFL